jgi:hydrogenase nickel incorporation protein HypA/HybF
MHEVGLMAEALEIALDHARQSDASRIAAITMMVGERSGVVPEALTFAFDVISRGTMAEGATLSIESDAAVRRCASCGWTAETGRDVSLCPSCLGAIRLDGGYDLRVASIEVIP